MKSTVLVMSCEHAVNTVPAEYQHVFAHHHAILESPQAYDLGALDITAHLQQTLHCDVIQSTITRLLIDCDHSVRHSLCFSKFSKKCTAAEKTQLIEQYYTPFYQQLEHCISTHVAAKKQVLHVSIHTFAPKLNGFLPNTGIGISYASRRHGEKEVARLIHGLLLQETMPYKIRLNYPFSGSKDFVLSHFRKQFEQQDYLGIKIDINQALLNDVDNVTNICQALTYSIQELLVLL